MNEPFVPHKPEKRMLVEVFGREASLIKKLRKYAFGKFTIQKVDNMIIRIEINESQIIEENDGDDLAVK